MNSRLPYLSRLEQVILRDSDPVSDEYHLRDIEDMISIFHSFPSVGEKREQILLKLNFIKAELEQRIQKGKTDGQMR